MTFLLVSHAKDDTAAAASSFSYDNADPQQHQLPRTPPEAIGLGFDMFARGTVFMSSIFLGPALLEQASLAAQCDDDAISACRIYGFRPSSLLSNMAMVSGLLASLLLPLFGAVVDHTPHRRLVGKVTAYGLVLIKAAEVVVGPRTWLLVACLQVGTALLYQPHIAATYVYTSELTTLSTTVGGGGAAAAAMEEEPDDEDNEADDSSTMSTWRPPQTTIQERRPQHPQQPKTHTYYNTLYAMIQQLSFLQFCIIVLGLSAALGATTVMTARISQMVTTLTAGPLFYLAWNCYMRPCPQTKMVPVGSNIWTCGFLSATQTVRRIWSSDGCNHRHNNRALRWLLSSILVSEAASQTLVAVATTYMTTVLHMEAHAIGKVFLAVLICGVGGAKLGAVVATTLAGHGVWRRRRRRCEYDESLQQQPEGDLNCRHHAAAAAASITADPVASAMCAQVYFCVITTAACLVLNGPADQQYTYIFGGLWGVALGWLSPMHASAYMGLLQQPAQQQQQSQAAEMMGIYLLASNLLSWLPALVFTLLNEAGANMKWGMASLNVYFVIGLACLVRLGDFSMAVAQMREAELESELSEELELKTKIMPLVALL